MYDREQYHLTYGEFRDILKRTPGNYKIRIFGWPERNISPSYRSYRGFYEDLAFKWGEWPMTVDNFYAPYELALNDTIFGYKGGEYIIKPDTVLWIADYGTVRNSAAIIDAVVDDFDHTLWLVIKYCEGY